MAANGVERGSNALGAALTFAVAVTAFTWGGYRADLALGTRPLFLIVGAALGGVGGFLHMVYKLAPDALPWTTGTSGGTSSDAPSHEGAAPDEQPADGEERAD
jgi:hypothetical protein